MQIQHTYAAVGIYTVALTASNSRGQVTVSLDATVIDRVITGLSATVSYPTYFGYSTDFSAAITDGTNVSYSWDFGDGASGSGANVSHIYEEIGDFIATLTASNSRGQVTDTVTASVVILYISPITEFSSSSAKVLQGNEPSGWLGVDADDSSWLAATTIDETGNW